MFYPSKNSYILGVHSTIAVSSQNLRPKRGMQLIKFNYQLYARTYARTSTITESLPSLDGPLENDVELPCDTSSIP